jgi:hypothetical protein
MRIKILKLSVLLLSIFAVTQTANAQTKVGLRAGVNFSNLKYEDELGKKTDTKPVSGIQIGLTADIPLVGSFYVQPGLVYAQRGFKEETGATLGYGVNFEVKADYFEIPVNFLFKPEIGSGKVLIGAGPYVGFGSGGSWTSDSQVVVQGDIAIGNKGDVIFRNDGSEGLNLESYNYGRPVDYGAGFLLGYEHKSGVFLQGNAQIGVANLQSRFGDFQPKGSKRNNSFGLSIGYKF